MFYDPTLGVGEFYHTNNGFDDLSFSSNTGYGIPRGQLWSRASFPRAPQHLGAPTICSSMIPPLAWGCRLPPALLSTILCSIIPQALGEFYHTNNGFDDSSFSSNTGWRRTWSIILAGKFSDNAAPMICCSMIPPREKRSYTIPPTMGSTTLPLHPSPGCIPPGQTLSHSCRTGPDGGPGSQRATPPAIPSLWRGIILGRSLGTSAG